MNRTLKDANVKCDHYESHDQLREHLAALQAAYTFAKRLKALRALTPHEYVRKTWNADKAPFLKDAIQPALGL
jgi:hypothetical protein